MTLPLTYIDIFWMDFNRMRRILFYRLPNITKTYFVQTIIPQLKNSLSLTLKHYIPLAGNLVRPLNSSGYPELRYVTGDSVTVTFSETDMDFNFLIGNHPRKAKDFYQFVPTLAKAKSIESSGAQLAPLLAIQVTLFPNHGISIGFTYHHVAGDGASMFGFTRAWALINKFDFLEHDHQFAPSFDRSVIKDPYDMGMSLWDEKKNTKLEMCDIVVTPPDDKVRGTFIMGRADIEKLKNVVLSRLPSLSHVTSLTVTCAYVWTCLIKSEEAVIESEIDENALEFFLCVADCRAQFSPPVPANYFGNFIVGYIIRARHCELAGREGFTNAVEKIGEMIETRKNDGEWVMSGEYLKEYHGLDAKRMISIAGSPKHELYAADFGWGRPEKIEFISIDSGSGVGMSLYKCRDSEGDLEVGLSLSKSQMNAFAAIFTHGLSFL